MVPWSLILCLSVLFNSAIHYGESVLRVSNYFSDHVVLQRGPQQAVIWGTSDGDAVTATLKHVNHGHDVASVTTQVVKSNNAWKLKLPPQTNNQPFILTLTASDGQVVLNDVVFGDVWLCSGQSNMGFNMGGVMNSSVELEEAKSNQQIRYVRVAETALNSPQDSVSYTFNWAKPNETNHLTRFSAVCYLFGKYLSSKVGYHIGLVQSSWGGTPIEAWSSPTSLAACSSGRSTIQKRDQHTPSSLYNAMIHPLLSNTIYGTLWYQGESNSGHYVAYACQIEEMIKDWRQNFHTQSLGQTSSSFPFGFVQLAALEDGDRLGSFPFERWAQTGNYGYNPNPAMPNTFMAVAMDLPDHNSPFGVVHPRYKQEVAQRLLAGAWNVAYGHPSYPFQGPFPTDIALSSGTLTITYDHGKSHLDVRNNNNFEVCCSSTNASRCDVHNGVWVKAPIVSHTDSTVTLTTASCRQSYVLGMRYAWRQTPCPLRNCALYSLDGPDYLPAPPYITFTLKPTVGASVGLVG